MPFEYKKGNSTIAFPNQYVCIDIETTGLDYEYDEIIEVSAVRVVDGNIKESFSSLINPQGSVPSYIENLTGITNEMLSVAPPAEKIIPDLISFIGSDLVIGYNVSFDIHFLCAYCSSFDVDFLNDYTDVMRIFRKLFPSLEHHRLCEMVEQLNIDISTSHRATADVLATMEGYEKMKSIILESSSLDDFSKSFKKTSFKNYVNGLKDVLPSTNEFDETHPIFGKTVVFTGALSSMGRKEAFQIVADLGGFPETGITKKTNFLVVGNGEFAKSVTDGKTSKMKKADAYREIGLDIVTLSENTFFRMIDHK